MKATSVFLICLLVFAVIYGLSATLLWCSEEVEDLEYCGKTMLGNRIPHSLNVTFVGNRIPHSFNVTFVGNRIPHSSNVTFV